MLSPTPSKSASRAFFNNRICGIDRKSTRLNSSHSQISYAVFCLKKKKQHNAQSCLRDEGPARRKVVPSEAAASQARLYDPAAQTALQVREVQESVRSGRSADLRA